MNLSPWNLSHDLFFSWFLTPRVIRILTFPVDFACYAHAAGDDMMAWAANILPYAPSLPLSIKDVNMALERIPPTDFNVSAGQQISARKFLQKYKQNL